MTYDALILSILNLYGPMTTPEISSAVGADLRHNYRLMRSLERYGFVKCEVKMKLKNKDGITTVVNRWRLLEC